MSEFITGEMPDDLKAVLEEAPEPIKSLLKKAIGAGKGIKIINLGARKDEKSEEKPAEEKPCEEKPKEKPKAGLGGILDMLLKPPSTLDMLKMIVTKVIEAANPGCQLCVALTRRPTGPPIARCVEGLDSVSEILLKGLVKATEETTVEEKTEILAKVFRVKASELRDLFKKGGLFKDEKKDNDGKEGA
jgi:hypothetical protein